MQDYIIDSINRILVEEINNLRTEGKREHWVDVKNEHYPQSLTEWRLLFGFPSIIIIVGDDKRINETKESIKNFNNGYIEILIIDFVFMFQRGLS
jgi:hypothetical protein